MKLKTKLSLGLTFLFIVILCFGILGIYYIHRLSNDADQVIKNNHETLLYCNNILQALEDMKTNPQRTAAIIEDNIRRQENNVTEPGEKDETEKLRNAFEQLLKDTANTYNYSAIRLSIHKINELNQNAILRKNAVAHQTAEDAILWLSAIFTILTLIAFIIVVNFPSIISRPINALNEGIKEIANKNYTKRIYLKQRDEFGELANAFNAMAQQLDDYENSNLNQLMFEKKRIETIINQMRDAIIGLDENKHILFMNVLAENLLGMKEKDAAGKYAADIALRNDLMRALLQDDKKELKIYADGKESFFNRENITVKNEENVIGEVIVLRNITPFHELDEAKTNFIAAISHELKTPLSSIKMSTKLMKDDRVGTLNDEQQELLKSISDDAERLLKITSELLNMTQVETGNIQLKIQSTNVLDIVNKAVEAVYMQAQQKNIHIETHLQDWLPHIQADTEKTTWVLINLLTNAIKHSPESAGIEIEVYPQEKEIVFSVIDHGKGIDEKYLAHIFDRYYKVPGESAEGTGLGLTISKEFIEAQGGSIWAESAIGEGSKFSFKLHQA
jgi:PAS domain S-box-containing protein